MKISVVIPLFNEESLIEQIGKSLRAQTHQDLEIIFVDDASTDGSLKKIEGLCELDSRVSVVRLSTNRGGGGSHNAGIDNATGDYVCILDADDSFVCERSIEYLVEIAERNKDDIVMGNTLSLSQISDGYAVVELNKVTFRNVPTLVYNHSVWNKLYRRQFLLENQIRFQEGKFAYDILYSARTNIAAQSISITNKHTYFYSTGRQMARATETKIIDARNNVFEAMNLFENTGDRRVAEISRIKTLKNSFNTLARVKRALTDDQILDHLDIWRTKLLHIPEKSFVDLPEEVARFHCQLRVGNVKAALKTWQKTQGFKRSLRQYGFQLVHSQVNTPKRPRLIRFAKAISRRLG